MLKCNIINTYTNKVMFSGTLKQCEKEFVSNTLYNNSKEIYEIAIKTNSHCIELTNNQLRATN